jgi:hypothetical protein
MEFLNHPESEAEAQSTLQVKKEGKAIPVNRP